MQLTPGGAPVSWAPSPPRQIYVIAPLTGDEGAFGFAKVVVNAGNNGRVCYRLSVANIAPATAAGFLARRAGAACHGVGPDGLGDGCVEVAPRR